MEEKKTIITIWIWIRDDLKNDQIIFSFLILDKHMVQLYNIKYHQTISGMVNGFNLANFSIHHPLKTQRQIQYHIWLSK